MERSKAKEAGRKKAIQEKANALKDRPPRRAPAKEVIKQAGRYHAIETARKQLIEAQQAIAPDREQQPYTAVDMVEDYAGSIAHDLVRFPVPTLERSRREAKKNAFHHETQKASASSLKKPSAKYLMRREAVKEYKRKNTSGSIRPKSKIRFTMKRNLSRMRRRNPLNAQKSKCGAPMCGRSESRRITTLRKKTP